jgi:hypothetical protein
MDSPFSGTSRTTRATQLDNGPIHTGQRTSAEIYIVAVSHGPVKSITFLCHTGWPEYASPHTTQLGRKVLIFHTTWLGQRITSFWYHTAWLDSNPHNACPYHGSAEGLSLTFFRTTRLGWRVLPLTFFRTTRVGQSMLLLIPHGSAGWYSLSHFSVPHGLAKVCLSHTAWLGRRVLLLTFSISHSLARQHSL